MCEFFSCIVCRDGSVKYLPNSSSHTKIIEVFGLKDVELIDRDIVRIEITPRSFEMLLSKNRADWSLDVDEPKTIPVWFEADTRKYIELAWKAWEEHINSIELNTEITVEYLHNMLKYEFQLYPEEEFLKKLDTVDLENKIEIARKKNGMAFASAVWNKIIEESGALERIPKILYNSYYTQLAKKLLEDAFYQPVEVKESD